MEKRRDKKDESYAPVKSNFPMVDIVTSTH